MSETRPRSQELGKTQEEVQANQTLKSLDFTEKNILTKTNSNPDLFEEIDPSTFTNKKLDSSRNGTNSSIIVPETDIDPTKTVVIKSPSKFRESFLKIFSMFACHCPDREERKRRKEEAKPILKEQDTHMVGSGSRKIP